MLMNGKKNFGVPPPSTILDPRKRKHPSTDHSDGSVAAKRQVNVVHPISLLENLPKKNGHEMPLSPVRCCPTHYKQKFYSSKSVQGSTPKRGLRQLVGGGTGPGYSLRDVRETTSLETTNKNRTLV